MRLVFLGSGAFGLPTLESLAGKHEIALVVTQPDRPAGRNRQLTPTPIGEHAVARGWPTIKPEKVNDPAVVQRIRSVNADAFVVIAFGQKLGRALLDGAFAINLHGSLLPKYRGAAPINWAIINGERETGVSVIALADRMDAGDVYAMSATTVEPHSTAGEMHDRLALLGPMVMHDVLDRHAEGEVIGQPQDERLATHAPKLNKADGTVRFDQPAVAVRNRIHGLTPWPGCVIKLDGREVRVLRAEVMEEDARRGEAGEVLGDHSIACGAGVIRLLEVQPAGRAAMSFDAYRNGHAVRIGVEGGAHRMSKGLNWVAATLWELVAPSNSKSKSKPIRIAIKPRTRSIVPRSESIIEAVRQRASSSSTAVLAPKAAALRTNPTMQERYDALVEEMKHAHNVRVRKWRKSSSGVAWLIRYRDGSQVKLIESPYPRGPMSCAIFMHEIGHHAIGLGVHRPRCLEEYHVWLWAIREMRERGFNVTPAVEKRFHDSMKYAVRKARKRGLQALPVELRQFV